MHESQGDITLEVTNSVQDLMKASYVTLDEEVLVLGHRYGCAPPEVRESQCKYATATQEHHCYTEQGENLGGCNYKEGPWVTAKHDLFTGRVRTYIEASFLQIWCPCRHQLLFRDDGRSRRPTKRLAKV